MIKSISDYRVTHNTSVSRLTTHPNVPDTPNSSTKDQLKALPSIEIDLGDIYAIDNVIVKNRPNDKEYRNKSLIVEASCDRACWTVLHAGLLYWQGALTLPTSGAVRCRYLKFSLTERTPLILEKIEVNARIYQDSRLPAFVARRADGLGERLNALLNAIWLSEIFATDFRFFWSDALIDNSMHAIAPAGSMFSEDFLARYHDKSLKSRAGWAITGRHVQPELIKWKLAQTGLVDAPRAHLKTHMVNQPETADAEGLKRAFERIGFSKAVNLAIQVAERTPVTESAVAIHLRSGDVFYGEYRKHPNYSYKGITTPLAKLLIKHFVDQGREVFLFGQDTEQLEYLAQNCGAINSTSLNKDSVETMEPHQKAMYDLRLLSRFQTILAGTSGFARQASWIGGGDVLTPSKLFDAQEQHRASLEDLARNAHLYHPQQSAYSYWYAYHHGRHERDLDTNIEVMRNALHFDPENELYFFVLSALLVRKGNVEQSSEVLETLFAERMQSKRQRTVFSIFTLRNSRAEYKLEEYFPDFLQAADEGRFFHCALMFFLARSRKDNEEIKRRFAACRDSLDLENSLHRSVFNYIEVRMTHWRNQGTDG